MIFQHLVVKRKKIWRECRNKCGNWTTNHGFGMCDMCCEDYDKDVYVLTRETRMKLDIPEYLRNDWSQYHYEIDHIVPVWYGREYGIPYYEIASVDNLQLMLHKDNSFVGGKGTMLPEKWINHLTSREWKYRVGKEVFGNIRDLCEVFGLRYVKVASGFIKTGNMEIVVNGIVIQRVI